MNPIEQSESRLGAQVIWFDSIPEGAPLSEEQILRLGLGFARPNRPLRKCGGDQFVDDLMEIDREQACLFVAHLIHKDLPYSTPGEATMAECQALAEQWIDAHSTESARYYSNGDWEEYFTTNAGAWNPLTTSTFDGGVIISNQDSTHVFWAEGED